MTAAGTAGWLLDTNIISHAIRGRLGVRERLHTQPHASLRVPAVALAELEYGSLKAPDAALNRARWRLATRDLVVLPFDQAAAVEHARLRLALRHSPIGERDLMIAAIALAHRLGVATANAAEFKRVPKLKVVDWTR